MCVRIWFSSFFFFFLNIRAISFLMTFSDAPHVSPLFLIWEQQIKVLCQSYLMGLASPACFFWQASLHLFYTSFLSSSSPFLSVFSPPPLSSACVCVTCRTKWGGIMREKKKLGVDPPAPPVRLTELFVVPQQSELSPLIILFLCSVLSPPPLLRRRTRWPGPSWSQWTPTTPQTTTESSRNRWVSGNMAA